MVLDCRGLDRGIPILLTWLQRDGVIAPESVPRVLDAMGDQSVSVEEAVVGLTGVNELDIAERYARFFHVPLAGEEKTPDTGSALAALLPERFCREHLMVPIARTRTGMAVAMVDPSRNWLHAQMTMMTGLDVDISVAPLSRVALWIERLFPGAPAA